MQKPEETIKFVKEYLADPSCKTDEEVKASSKAAAVYCDAIVAAVYAAVYAADAVAADAVDWADGTASAEYWVKRYEKLTQKEG